MEQITVRLAIIDDVEKLAEIIKKYRAFYNVATEDILKIKDFVTERIEKSQSVIFIAIDKTTENILGFTQLYPSYSTVSLKPQWILNDLYVEETERKRGIASLLMDATVEYFKGKAKGFILVTAKTNTAAKKFYDKHGWKTDMYDFYTYSLE